MRNGDTENDDRTCSRNENSPLNSPPNRRKPEDKEESLRLWGILIFGIIGATATTFAIGHLRKTADFFYAQVYIVTSLIVLWHVVALFFQWSHSAGQQSSGRSSRSSFQEEAWKKYNRRMQEEHEDEVARVERIRRMQSVFNRERNKYKRGYETRRENESQGEYHQHFQRDDWYWKNETINKERGSNFRAAPRAGSGYVLSQHYAVLGLSRSRTEPYTEAEIKTAFQTKAKEFHPDQNQENKEAAEAKFREILTSYEAIKKERKETRRA